MKKSSVLFLAGIGMALITTGPAFAQEVHPRQNPGTAIRIFNNLTGPADLSTSFLGNSGLAAANKPSRGSAVSKLNSGSNLAMLTGVLTLRFLQRRNHIDIVLKPRH